MSASDLDTPLLADSPAAPPAPDSALVVYSARWTALAMFCALSMSTATMVRDTYIDVLNL
jgi:hypothetical protein